MSLNPNPTKIEGRQQYEQFFSQVQGQKVSMSMQIDNKINEQIIQMLVAKDEEIASLKKELKNRQTQREEAKRARKKSKA